MQENVEITFLQHSTCIDCDCFSDQHSQRTDGLEPVGRAGISNPINYLYVELYETGGIKFT